MCKLNEKYQLDWKILKCDYIRYSPLEIFTINTPISQTYIIIPREDSVKSIPYSHLAMNFDVLHAASNDRYADNDDIRLVNLGGNALFSKYNLTSSSGKHIENIEHGHIASLMYKIITSARDTDDLSIMFDRSRDRRQKELINNKNIKGKYHIRFYSKDFFGFAENDKATLGLG